MNSIRKKQEYTSSDIQFIISFILLMISIMFWYITYEYFSSKITNILIAILIGIFIMLSPLSIFAVTWLSILGAKITFYPNTQLENTPLAIKIGLTICLWICVYISIKLQWYWIEKTYNYYKKY